MSTLEKLQQILIAHYPVQVESITRDAKLEQLEIDSLGIMELFFAIEDEFRISVPNDKRAINTVGDLVGYIDELIAQQGSVSASGRSGMASSDTQQATS